MAMPMTLHCDLNRGLVREILYITRVIFFVKPSGAGKFDVRKNTIPRHNYPSTHELSG